MVKLLMAYILLVKMLVAFMLVIVWVVTPWQIFSLLVELLPILPMKIIKKMMQLAVLHNINKYIYSNKKSPKIGDRKSTRLNSSHVSISYAVFCLKKKIRKNS